MLLNIQICILLSFTRRRECLSDFKRSNHGSVSWSIGDPHLPSSVLCCQKLKTHPYGKDNVLYESSVLCRLLCWLFYDRRFFLFITTGCHFFVSRSFVLWLSTQFCLVLLQTKGYRPSMVYSICSLKMESSVSPICEVDCVVVIVVVLSIQKVIYRSLHHTQYYEQV